MFGAIANAAAAMVTIDFGINSGSRSQNVTVDNLLVNDYANVVSTPIPGTLILFISGLAGLLLARRLNWPSRTPVLQLKENVRRTVLGKLWE